MVCISTEESFFILKYNAEAVTKALQTKENLTEDGVEDAFDVVAEIQEVVKTGEQELGMVMLRRRFELVSLDTLDLDPSLVHLSFLYLLGYS